MMAVVANTISIIMIPADGQNDDSGSIDGPLHIQIMDLMKYVSRQPHPGVNKAPPLYGGGY